MPIGTAIGIGISAAGVGLQAYGQHKAGEASQEAGAASAKAAESEAQLADFNAHVADLQAEDALERGGEQANRFAVQVRQAIGTQRAGFAAGNIDVSSGSAADVQADAAFVGKLDELTIRTNAARQAWGYQVTAANYRQQAVIDREKGVADIAAGDASATAGNIAAVGTIATGAGSLLGQRYGFKNAAS